MARNAGLALSNTPGVWRGGLGATVRVAGRLAAFLQRLNYVAVGSPSGGVFPSGGVSPSGGDCSPPVVSPPVGSPPVASVVGPAHTAGLPLHVSPSAHFVILPPSQKPCTSGLARQVLSGSLHSLLQGGKRVGGQRRRRGQRWVGAR